ncbi:MAG: phenylalanine--tRNA ligase subunit alpha [Gammaproteobacteria bacterium]|nr:phenylalanine--tRNA ligase subunit alpha [Gammaproteobacteria bacterium]|tara:strand:- start:3060 stop:4046 length:987 start_codon:yes stop_codon:yes gene_type:complete
MAVILSDLLSAALKEIQDSKSLDSLDSVRVNYLGKKGKITVQLKLLGSMDPKQKPIFGQEINTAKQRIENELQLKKIKLKELSISENIQTSSIDVTLPGRTYLSGSIHPITTTLIEIETILLSAGFLIQDGPEIENEYYNFSALNIPENHPARAMHDTFYLGPDLLLRTHTSPIQIRSMENEGVPIKVIAPGKVYRRDSDLTHIPMFHQVEGLVIDENINFSHLKGILREFINTFFNKELEMRFRPSYFPFTEPSAEVDILSEDGKWLEILGCGMVHPNVLENLDLDSEIYTGYAFGMGVERLAMLKYNIKDIRLFYENDLNFLNQFS